MTPPAPPGGWRWVAPLGGLGAVLGLVLQRAERCAGCAWTSVLAADALIVAILLVLFAVNVTAAPAPVRVAANAASAALVAVHVADQVLFADFATRFDLRDALAFAGDPGSLRAVLSWMGAQGGRPRTALHALVLAGLPVYVVWVSRSRYRPSRRAAAGITAAGATLLALHGLAGRGEPARHWATADVLTVNRDSGLDVGYSPAHVARLAARGPRLTRRDRCFAGRGARPSIVLVIVESFSAYHSALFSGLQDLTPNLDRMARRGTAFRRFHANGWTTEGGLIAILGGRHPLPPIGGPDRGRVFNYGGFHDLPDALPRTLGRAGYHTAFLATADLSYKRTAGWLRSIGFDEVEDRAAPFYAAAPRHVFGAAPDEFLYRRALGYLAERRGGAPLLLVLETVSSHSPYRDPATGAAGEAAAVRYADARLGDFFDRLLTAGFLDGNLLVVTADHRAMTPVRPGEAALFGASAPARIPLVVVGAGVPAGRLVDEPFQQADLAPSLESIVGERYCLSRLQGNLFDPARGVAECILHVGGTRRDRVSAFCPGGAATIRLRGDATALAAGQLPDAAEYADEIGYLRAVRPWRPGDPLP